MEGLWIFVVIIVYVINGLFWGSMTQNVADRKNLGDGWFKWGFFFGLTAWIIASSKEENHYQGYREPFQGFSRPKAAARPDATLWHCDCGRDNPAYVGTCACGRTKAQMLNKGIIPQIEETGKEKEQPIIEEPEKDVNVEQELKDFALIRELKALLDEGAITQEEYDAKKKQLLGI